MKKLLCVICGKCRKFWNPKTSFVFEKTLVLLFVVSAKMKMKNYFKEKNQLRH